MQNIEWKYKQQSEIKTFFSSVKTTFGLKKQTKTFFSQRHRQPAGIEAPKNDSNPRCFCLCVTLLRAATINHSFTFHKVYIIRISLQILPHFSSSLLHSYAVTRQESTSTVKHHGRTSRVVQLWCQWEPRTEVFFVPQFIFDMCLCVSLVTLWNFTLVFHLFCSYSVVLWWTYRCVCLPAAAVCEEHSLAAERRRDLSSFLRLMLIISSCHLANILGITRSWLTGEGFHIYAYSLRQFSQVKLELSTVV